MAGDILIRPTVWAWRRFHAHELGRVCVSYLVEHVHAGGDGLHPVLSSGHA